MTLKERILEHVNARPGRKFSNNDIAVELEAPVASVRRATYQLFREGNVRDTGFLPYQRGLTIASNSHDCF